MVSKISLTARAVLALLAWPQALTFNMPRYLLILQYYFPDLERPQGFCVGPRGGAVALRFFAMVQRPPRFQENGLSLLYHSE